MFTLASLFEDERLAELLKFSIEKNNPKYLEKTKWWKFLLCESFKKDSPSKLFLNNYWPVIIEEKYDFAPWYKTLLSQLIDLGMIDIGSFKINKAIKDYLIDEELIKTIKEEQSKIKLAKNLRKTLCGPTPKTISVIKNFKPSKCVAILESKKGTLTYKNIHSFLIDLSGIWISNLEKGSLNIDCNNQITEEKDVEIAEIIFSNFPKTFSEKTVKENHLYICSYNWNFLNSKQNESDF
jgi:hypothetical protein